MTVNPELPSGSLRRFSPLRRSTHEPTIAQRGTRRVAEYYTGPEDCVRVAGAGREWSDKPPVVASCAVILRCEEVCMAALLETMPEGYCSLGTAQYLEHTGPIAVGSTIRITADCTQARGRYSSWQVTVEDEYEIVGEGRMDFVAVYRPHYEARVLARKQATSTGHGAPRLSVVGRMA